MRFIEIGCNTAVDAGLYTFTFAKTGEEVSGRYSFTYRWNGSDLADYKPSFLSLAGKEVNGRQEA